MQHVISVIISVIYVVALEEHMEKRNKSTFFFGQVTLVCKMSAAIVQFAYLFLCVKVMYNVSIDSVFKILSVGNRVDLR